jgi:hypothetical protein
MEEPRFLGSLPFTTSSAARLAGTVYATEKSAKMPSQPYKQHRERFDRQAVFWQGFLWMAPPPQVDPKHQPDQHTRYATENQVHQQNPF